MAREVRIRVTAADREPASLDEIARRVMMPAAELAAAVNALGRSVDEIARTMTPAIDEMTRASPRPVALPRDRAGETD